MRPGVNTLRAPSVLRLVLALFALVAPARLARTRGINVPLIGTPEPGMRNAAPQFYGAIAEDFRVPYEAPIHPNAAGYRLIAERVTERLRQSGAL
jgi:acyl-CoA thioesterase I